jgi:hypothetical protein
MTKLGRAFLVLIGGLLSSLALVASASGTTATPSAKMVRHLPVPVAALAMDGSRIAYDSSARYVTKPQATNRVLVWDVRTGKTVEVSGEKTAAADSTSTGVGVVQLAIAGSRVAWLVNEGGNLEGDDYLFTSSITNPKERQVASAVRTGDNCPGRQASHCAGKWLGGLVGAGDLIAANRWTTDGSGAVTAGELDVLGGAKLSQIATGADTVLATSADQDRIVVLRSDGTVAMYSSSGNLLRTVTPSSARAVALNKHALVVLTKTRTLELYYAPSGRFSKKCPVHGTQTPHSLDVQGDIAVYTVGDSVHAQDLGSCKDRVIGTLHNRIAFARIDSAGLAYAANGTGKTFGKGTLVFVPLARVKAAVG